MQSDHEDSNPDESEPSLAIITIDTDDDEEPVNSDTEHQTDDESSRFSFWTLNHINL